MRNHAEIRVQGDSGGEQLMDRSRGNSTSVPVSVSARITASTDSVPPSVPKRSGPLRTLGGPLLFLLSILGILAMGVLEHGGSLSLSDWERAELDYLDSRAEYDDYITRGTPSSDLLELPTVKTKDLEALVDLAIDTDNRVIENPDQNQHMVVDSDVVFVYNPPIVIEGDTSRQ